MPEILDNLEPARVKVDIINLDNYCSDKGVIPDLIKIDAENFELQVINGFKKTIRQYRPKIIMECGSEGSLEAAKYLLTLKYTPYISDIAGSFKAWEHSIEKANILNKDLLFLPVF